MNSELSKIPSFTIDHERLLRGIYVSRKDEVGGEIVTTFDIHFVLTTHINATQQTLVVNGKGRNFT